MNIVRRDQFLGANNIAKPERLPEGAVADAVNFDFTVGGKAELRTGFEKVADFTDLRALYALGSDLVLVDDDRLVRYSHGVTTDLGRIDAGPVAAVQHNSELLLNTQTQSIRLSGGALKAWGVKPPAFGVSVTAGNLPAGVYRVAVTATEDDVESGCIESVITLGGGQAIQVDVSDARHCTLYCTVTNGTTLYKQGVALSSNRINRVEDATARCQTAGLESLPFCSILESHNGIVLGASGRFLYHTAPMLPHLHDPIQGFIAYPEPITLLASTPGGVFVCAGKTYFVTGFGGEEFMQRQVLDFGGVAGTTAKLPDGSAAWFSRYGQVIGHADGSTTLSNRSNYAPGIALDGAAGLLEHNGNQLVVTTMRGEVQGNNLHATDFWDLEVINNE